MIEAEWLSSTNPLALLKHLEAVPAYTARFDLEYFSGTVPVPPGWKPGRKSLASDRKMRLFAVACARQVWHLLDLRSQRTVEVAELLADGKTSVRHAEETRGAMRTSRPVPFETELAWRCAGPIESLNGNVGLPRWFSVSTKQRGVQAGLMREIVGNPFGRFHKEPGGMLKDEGPPRHYSFQVKGFDNWLTWQDSTVPKLAAGIYEERAFDRLPILADALEDAGCDNGAILMHCRGDGPHVRGCWVLDLLLGKD